MNELNFLSKYITNFLLKSLPANNRAYTVIRFFMQERIYSTFMFFVYCMYVFDVLSIA